MIAKKSIEAEMKKPDFAGRVYHRLFWKVNINSSKSPDFYGNAISIWSIFRFPFFEDVPAGRNLRIAEKSVPVLFLSGNLKISTFQDCKIQTVSQFLYLYI